MTQAVSTTDDKELISLLKPNNKGWNISLFDDQNQASDNLCAHCKSICCDAVELSCDHNDNDIFLYCSSCLSSLIAGNNQKCPINGHVNPSMTAVRAARRKVMNYLVICPYSIQYKSINAKYNTIDDINDEKEGVSNNNNKDCIWKGTLNELITKHIHQCKLQQDNEKLRDRNQELQNKLHQQTTPKLKSTGVVKFWNNDKGFGFIENDDGSDDLFVHHSYIHSKGFRSLAKNEKVEFDKKQMENGKWRAINVTGPNGAYCIGIKQNNSGNKERGGRGGRGRRGRGGRGRGRCKGGGGGCFKCGEQGHFARACPNIMVNKQFVEDIMKENDKFREEKPDMTDTKTNDDIVEKKTKDMNDEIVKKMVFNLSNEATGKMYVSDNGKTVHWKGKFLSLAHRVLIGNYLQNEENVTVYFEILRTGDLWNYGFGFISSKFKLFVGSIDDGGHQVMIYGNGKIRICDEFKNINKLKNQEALIDKRFGVNTIAMCVNIKEKMGVIWNSKKNVKFYVNLPENEPIGMIIRMVGTDKKSITITKVETK